MSITARPVAWRIAVLMLSIAWISQARALDDGANPPFVSTPPRVIERMLALAQLGSDDMLIDLGSGDGRIVIHAAKHFRARALGIELSSTLVASSRAAAAREGVADRARFQVGDVLQADLSPASVLTLYLSPGMNERLLPRILSAMRPGSRVVSHDFPLSTWTPDRVERLDAPEKNYGRGGESIIMLWIVPADAAGVWRATVGEPGNQRSFEFSLGQQFQLLEGAVLSGREWIPLQASLTGARIDIAFPLSPPSGAAARVRASLEGETMKGRWLVQGSERAVAFEARRTSTRPALY
jgi:SAM-dependent methyltransferase